MTQDFSLHTHTRGFDGLNTVEEMVHAAQALKWSKLGISNHFIVHPNVKNSVMYAYACKGGYAPIYSDSFEEALKKFIPLFREIKEVSARMNFPIYCGMEVDFFDNSDWTQGFRRAMQLLKPDYIIGSAHFIEYQGTLLNVHDMKKAQPDKQTEFLKIYWHNVRQAVRSGYFDFMAHLDLPARGGLGLGDEWLEEEEKTVALIAKTGVGVEINTASLKSRGEACPKQRILRLLGQYNVPVLLSDDAHTVEQMGRGYEQAADMANQAGIKGIVFPVKVVSHVMKRFQPRWVKDHQR